MKEDAKHKVSFDEEGNLILKEKEKVARGKKSKASGSQFELRVRRDLEDKGFIVDKWTNNVDLEKNIVVPAKRKMGFLNKNMRFMTIGTGFPDFIAIQRLDDSEGIYKVIGVEVKMNGLLSKVEKEKCKWYLDKKIFSDILIASKEKEKNRVRVVYKEFSTKIP